jgi:hypothetical protein
MGNKASYDLGAVRPNKPLHPTALRAAGERQGVGRVPVLLSGGRG